jgi:glutathione synthase/RimK-type ligase-like ATP-grasp enzyme
MWPPQEQVQTKWDMINKLDFVAARRTFSARPRTRPLVDGETISDRVVLKRTHSDMGQHVLLPRDKQDRRNWDYLRLSTDVPGCFWLAQTYINTLATLGEWRVFLIAGQIVYTVHTVYNQVKETWTWDVPTTYYSLDELRYVRLTPSR